MNTEFSMREIEPVLRDLLLHIQNLESENRALRDTVYQQSHKLSRMTEEAQALSFKSARFYNRMGEAAKQIKAVCREKEDLSARTVRHLWKALEILGE